MQDKLTWKKTAVKNPWVHILPPNILREQGVANNANTLVAQNEQSLASVWFKDGDSRAV
ncbi:MAG: hypothetical protein R2836_06920 [Chitinophagales bacterium]